ncbi:MAG: hypothetical protein Q7J54_02025 [Candidatus Woesearchaeota archaeon]|nr:hypothetical protein [Candidatus Woesearchaeota archaeon]
MKKYIMILAFVIFIAACTPQTDNNYKFEDVYKGVEGLRFSFLTNAPPREVYDGSPFQIIVNLENKGAADIEKGILAISLEKDYYTPQDIDNREINLYGRKITMRYGEQKREVYSISEVKIPETQSESHKTQIYVTACYQYQTTLKADVCIDTDVYNLKERTRSCRVSDYYSSSGQGAPVAITRIEETMLPEGENQIRPSYKIYVRNQGRGEVVLPDKVNEACGSKLSKDVLNKIKVKDVKLSTYSLKNGDFKCVPEQEGDILTLRESEDFIICELNNGISTEAASFLTGLEIDLEYGYTETISQEVKIVRKLIV